MSESIEIKQSDKEESTCPLCIGEMDWTDQQFKPCNCGYMLCVWCWHRIMDLAEKDGSNGRCPACLLPYDKDKIAKMTIDCKMSAKVNPEKKHKSPRIKTRVTKQPEDRSHLTDYRVIQKDLVYISGLPKSLADKETLQKKEFLGQYGKVIKAVTSPCKANIHPLSDSTCSIYITFSKEEEAIRCIQSINGFNLQGMPLKACYGTVKYCNAWLKNLPCGNPDCPYIHDVGRKEDICLKDEAPSACVSKVEQLCGIPLSCFPRRAGSCFPPPADIKTNKYMRKDVVIKPVHAIERSPETFLSNGIDRRCGIIADSVSWNSRVISCTSTFTGSEDDKRDMLECDTTSSTKEIELPARSLDVISSNKYGTIRDRLPNPHDMLGYSVCSGTISDSGSRIRSNAHSSNDSIQPSFTSNRCPTLEASNSYWTPSEPIYDMAFFSQKNAEGFDLELDPSITNSKKLESTVTPHFEMSSMGSELSSSVASSSNCHLVSNDRFSSLFSLDQDQFGLTNYRHHSSAWENDVTTHFGDFEKVDADATEDCTLLERVHLEFGSDNNGVEFQYLGSGMSNLLNACDKGSGRSKLFVDSHKSTFSHVSMDDHGTDDKTRHAPSFNIKSCEKEYSPRQVYFGKNDGVCSSIPLIGSSISDSCCPEVKSNSSINLYLDAAANNKPVLLQNLHLSALPLQPTCGRPSHPGFHIPKRAPLVPPGFSPNHASRQDKSVSASSGSATHCNFSGNGSSMLSSRFGKSTFF